MDFLVDAFSTCNCLCIFIHCFSHARAFTCVNACVCEHPNRSGRLLPSPRHAARFVALLPLAAPNSSPASGGALGGGEGSGQNGAPWPTHFTTVKIGQAIQASGGGLMLCQYLALPVFSSISFLFCFFFFFFFIFFLVVSSLSRTLFCLVLATHLSLSLCS